MYDKQRIREIAPEIQAIYDPWIDAGRVEEIDSRFWELLDELFSLYDPREQPNAAHGMARLSHGVVALRNYAAEFEAGGVSRHRIPSDFAIDLDVTVKALLADAPKLIPQPSVCDLVAQNVHPRQIACIWKLFDHNGHPDEKAVAAEKENPGSIVTPEHIEKVDQFRLAQLGFGPLAEYSYEPAEGMRRLAPPKVEPDVINPPNMDRMIMNGATVEQIARSMADSFGRTAGDWIPEVMARARELGRTLPLNAQQIRNGGLAEQVAAEERQRSIPLGMGSFPPAGLFGESAEKVAKEVEFFARPGQHVTKPAESEIAPEIVEQVSELHIEGNDPAAIAEHLGLPHQVVADAIKLIETAEVAG